MAEAVVLPFLVEHYMHALLELRQALRPLQRSAAQPPKRNRVWANSPLAKDSTLRGRTSKT